MKTCGCGASSLGVLVAERRYMILLLALLYIPEAEIDNALEYLNLERDAIQFARLEWLGTSLILPAVEELMHSPLSGEKYARKIKNALGDSLSGLIKTLSEDIEIQVGVPEITISSIPDIVTAINKSGKLCQEAFQNLTDREKLILIASLPGRWESEDFPEDDWLKTVLLDKYRLPFDTSGINEDTIMNIIQKVDYAKLIEAGIAMVLVATKAPELINGIEDSLLPLRFETEFGTLIIGTRNDDKYENIPFVIDPAGDDKYIDCGGTIGLVDPRAGISFIVDVEGNDVYRSNEIVSIASGLFGAAVLFDFEGDDYYYSTHYSIGSGYLGFGLLKDFEGDDVYRGGIFSLGAGNFGLGILIDSKGNDIYYTKCLGEGFGSTKGFGVLADFEGSDVYYAGGEYFDVPLNSNSYISMSQGFGIGRRPDFGGGIGFLYDKSGNDFYNGDVYAQGASCWCSAGFLIDDEGEDRYIATEYAEGAGIHLSYGFLSDLKGDDHYFSRMGPSLGEGHDLACGILVDSTGDDWYAVSGGMGVGLHNSFGLFADLSGSDVYNITENLGVGDANYSRGFSGVGIFLDLKGEDFYPAGRGNDESYWINGDYGIGVDKNSGEKEEVPQREVPDFSSMTIEEIFKIASEWEVGDNVDRVTAARNELCEKSEEALEYIFSKKLDTKDALELRAIEKTLKGIKDSLLVEKYLTLNINHKNERARKNVFVFIGELEMKALSDSLISVLGREGNEKYRRAIVYALGKLKEKRAVGKIISFLKEDEPLQLVSINTLGEIRDTNAISDLLPLVNSKSVTVRSAAMNSLAGFDTLFVPYLEKNTRKDFPPELLLVGAKAVQKDSSDYRDRVKKILFKYLDNSERRKREYAVRGLSTLGGEDVESKLKAMLDSEKNPVVESIIRRFLDKLPQRH
jgi:HEAT repeat protein